MLFFYLKMVCTEVVVLIFAGDIYAQEDPQSAIRGLTLDERHKLFDN
jgi:hypothetical protein